MTRLLTPLLLVGASIMAHQRSAAAGGHTIAATAAGGFSACSELRCTGPVVEDACYHDGARDRVMNDANYSSAAMSRAACVTFCRYSAPGAPYGFAAVEDGHQCFCGRTHPKPPPAKSLPAWCGPHGAAPGAHGCNGSCANGTPNTEPCCCTGNASEACGAVGIAELLDVSAVQCSERRIDTRYCDPGVDHAARVEDLLAHLSPAEKYGCLGSRSCDLSRLGIGGGATHWGEALHGLLFPCISDVPGFGGRQLCPTSFPHAQLLAATFNRSLFGLVGDTISLEARAFYNLWRTGKSNSGHWVLSFFAPDINLCRDPRWGRCLEVPGEDPYLSGEYAIGYVAAMQQRDASGNFTRTRCNAKHFSAYDVEKGATNQGRGDEYNRGSFNATVLRRDLLETYFPHFRAAVKGGGLGGTMCSYNAVNGVPSCANTEFNDRVLRAGFGFDGMVVSDCGAVAGIMSNHHFANTLTTTVRAGLRGGTDLDCGTIYTDWTAAALKEGTIDDADVTTALRRVLGQLITVGLAERSVPWGELDEHSIDTPGARALAQQAAEQGIVLLKNERGTLPLSATAMATPKAAGAATTGGKLRLAVLGPHLNSSQQLLANYHGGNVLVEQSTPLAALLRRPEVDVVAALAGCDLLDPTLPPDYDAAAAAARKADVAVVFVGLHTNQGAQVKNTDGMEREGFDRTNLTLPGYQEPLIRAIAATGTPTVVVMINSGGLAAPWVYKNVPAVIEVRQLVTLPSAIFRDLHVAHHFAL